MKLRSRFTRYVYVFRHFEVLFDLFKCYPVAFPTVYANFNLYQLYPLFETLKFDNLTKP